MGKFKKYIEKRSKLDIFLSKFIYFDKRLAYIFICGGILYGFCFPFWGLNFVKSVFGDEYIKFFTMLILTPQALLIFFIAGIIGKLFYKNKKIKCLKCGKISKGDAGFCPKCSNRIGWDNKGSKIVD